MVLIRRLWRGGAVSARLHGAESLLTGLALLTALAVYNKVAARLRERAEVSEHPWRSSNRGV
jgi:hypothetical protein